MTTQQTAQAETRQPEYIAYHIVESGVEGKKGRWHSIGAFFAHEDGLGGTLILDSLPLASKFDGRIVLRAPKAD